MALNEVRSKINSVGSPGCRLVGVRSVLTIIFLLTWSLTCSQQLLLLKGGRILTRYNIGDEIYFELKDQRQVHHTSIASLREFDFITVNEDTIQLSRVASIHFKNYARRKYSRGILLTGAALIGVYYLNSIAFDTSSPSMKGLYWVGVYGVAAGVVINLTSKKSVRLEGVKRLKCVPWDSPLIK